MIYAERNMGKDLDLLNQQADVVTTYMTNKAKLADQISKQMQL